MGKFTQVKQDAFEEMQLDAGVVVTEFDPTTGTLDKTKIVCATTGGINPSCVPTYSDLAEDVDNAPNNMMEYKHLDGWDCKISFTSLGTSAESIRLALGAADIDDTTGKITPRRTVKLADFKDIWWIGDRADGGYVAICLLNALSTGGFSLQTTKNGKGQVTVELTGHVSLDEQDVMPMEFYSADPAPASGGGEEAA